MTISIPYDDNTIHDVYLYPKTLSTAAELTLSIYKGDTLILSAITTNYSGSANYVELRLSNDDLSLDKGWYKWILLEDTTEIDIGQLYIGNYTLELPSDEKIIYEGND